MCTRTTIRLSSKLVILRLLLFCFYSLCFTVNGFAELKTEISGPNIQAQSAILIDYTTGDILYQKQPDTIIPPASLTKLMTIHVTLRQIEEGACSETEQVDIPEYAYAANMPPRSSLMFLGPSQKVTVEELIKGLSVASGNDAAIALASHVAGSVDAFVGLMNIEADRMGLENLHFFDPAGLDARNTVTAAEFAEFCREYIRLHPDSMEEYHAQKRIAYPLERNLTAEAPETSPIVQYNRNKLLWEYEGVDGLKTGYIDESGYNLAVTAQQDGMRLIGVLLGGQGANSFEGVARIAEDGRKLLDFGFNNFITVKPRRVELPSPRVWKGVKNTIPLVVEDQMFVTIPKHEREQLTVSYTINEPILAPVEKGEVVGNALVFLGNRNIKNFSLQAAVSVDSGHVFKRLFHTMAMWWEEVR